jgi:hypothetical protein
MLSLTNLGLLCSLAYSYGFARYENKQEAENCIRGLVSQKYEAGFARVSCSPTIEELRVISDDL